MVEICFNKCFKVLLDGNSKIIMILPPYKSPGWPEFRHFFSVRLHETLLMFRAAHAQLSLLGQALVRHAATVSRSACSPPHRGYAAAPVWPAAAWPARRARHPTTWYACLSQLQEIGRHTASGGCDLGFDPWSSRSWRNTGISSLPKY